MAFAVCSESELNYSNKGQCLLSVENTELNCCCAHREPLLHLIKAPEAASVLH